VDERWSGTATSKAGMESFQTMIGMAERATIPANIQPYLVGNIIAGLGLFSMSCHVGLPLNIANFHDFSIVSIFID